MNRPNYLNRQQHLCRISRKGAAATAILLLAHLLAIAFLLTIHIPTAPKRN